MGSFWETTRVLKTSIMGMPVRTMVSGRRRLTGFTEGPPISMGSSSRAVRPSRGCPEPSKMRPRRLSLKGICMGCPMKRTRSRVDTPWVPAKICRVTSSSCNWITVPREVPLRVVITARSS